MVSPFPGMDPYLEGYLWPDVQNKLSNAMAELLGAVIAPKYVARIELYTVADSNPEGDVGIMYPDVELFRRKEIAEEPLVNYQEGTTAISAATITIPDGAFPCQQAGTRFGALPGKTQASSYIRRAFIGNRSDPQGAAPFCTPIYSQDALYRHVNARRGVPHGCVGSQHPRPPSGVAGPAQSSRSRRATGFGPGTSHGLRAELVPVVY